MENGTPIRTGLTKNQPGNYAGIPGTGPALMTCRDCKYLDRDMRRGRDWPVCGKFRTMTGRVGTQIYTDTEACRYFETKAKL